MVPNTQRGEPIAIIGSGCRFPGSSSTPTKLWDLLENPRDVLTPIPSDRYNVDGFYHKDGTHHGATDVRDAYLLSEDNHQFDAQFFSIQPAEAESMDPQQRLLLETVYDSLDSAGLRIEDLKGSSTSVYVGLMCADYGDMIVNDLDSIPTYAATGMARSIISNRISYFFDWHGPSMTIDTACSSSLVAMHQAVQGLRSGESRVAVAAGANLILGPVPFIAESKLHMLSANGRSHMWDERADGYARGEGIASVVMKTLSAAIEDGDHIECIIRETGVNQDGRSKGITMPSQDAQADLIRATYARAGLNVLEKNDRCQYFEAHGTGTPAGDPVEAEAVSRAFFGPTSKSSDDNDVLYVGSIKTIVGHTEGTAGLAGVLKASLALQYSTIPPNMHFDKLSAAVEPFYNNLEIATVAKKWPKLPPGVPRRASVNSFGFGGTNAHAILEAYDPEQHLVNGSVEVYKKDLQLRHVANPAPLFSPFVFSAASEKALVAQLQSYSTYLQENPSLPPRDLAWTLQNRRSVLPFRASFSSQTTAALAEVVGAKLQASKDGASGAPGLAIRPAPGATRLLGVFTGQGAQWPSMGAALIRQSAAVEATIDELEQSLAELPISDRPSWSLKAEILAGGKASRLSEAALAQPLCTAIQVVLVDLLKSAGVVFDAVVGHSSGEIGAAYAAGFITSYDAIRIAYYRGFHARLARSSSGEKGGMLAVGTSLEDATEFCELSDFEGRIAVAACNSSSSVTLSGDLDAIQEASEVFEEEKKFVRMLKVDTAYHSYHMLPCAEAYMASLRACKIQLLVPSQKTSWYSSLREGIKMQVSSDLLDTYWKDNMVNTVLFSQAIEAAVQGVGSFSAALEVGPHPALQGPALSTIAEKLGSTIPYSGVLSRGKDDLESFTNAVGFLWMHSSKPSVDFETLERFACPKTAPPKLLKELPAYPFDHERRFWHESRITRAFHGRRDLPHEVLGVKSRSSTEREIQWHNTLKVKELPWLQGHKLQGQIVFPAAGYICMALKAAETLVPSDKTPSLIEIKDLVIHKAISFYDENSGVEVLFTFNCTDSFTDEIKTAGFTIYAALNKSSTEMTAMTTGRLEVTLAEPSLMALPARQQPVPNMTETAVDRFYDHLKTIGYEYTLDFQGMSATKRKMNFASGLIARPPTTDEDISFLMHPAVIDIAFQAVFLAYSAPNDGGLWSVSLPTHIQRFSINPLLCQIEAGRAVDLPFYSNLTDTSSAKIVADVAVYSEDSLHTVMQIEGMTASPLTPATPADDFPIFSETLWKVGNPDGNLIVTDADRATAAEIEFGYTLERIAFFYLKKLYHAFTKEEIERSAAHFQSLFNFAAHICSLVAEDKHPFAKKEWESDSHDLISSITKSYPESVDVKLMVAVGENLAAAVRGESDILSHMTKDNALFRFYKEALGIPQSNEYISRMMKQLSHRYPHTNILEIGGGTGGATKSILGKLGRSFSSYTFTDISAGFFANAQEQFQDQASKMIYKTLNIEDDIIAQGFTPASYDIVVASNVLHATQSIEKSLKNTRRLLKPGGYLILLEITNNGPMRLGFDEGGLPGWWAGKEEGRILAPTITPPQWNDALLNSGFAGIDTMTPDHDTVVLPVSIMAAQAVDNKIAFLRDPFSSPDTMPKIKDLILVGGTTARIAEFTKEVKSLLGPLCIRITVVDAVEDIATMVLPPKYSVLSVTDLDVPVFKDFTATKLESLQKIFDQASNVLWITAGCRADDPYANMSVGIGRSVRLEMPHVRFQYLDIPIGSKPEPKQIAETLMRLQVSSIWEQEGVLEKMLWTVEPEIAYENGNLMIPRIYEEEILNARFNSKRRPMTQEVAQATIPVEITCLSQDAYELREMDVEECESPISIRVYYSLLSSIKIKHIGYAFLGIGTDMRTNEKVIFISDHNSSIVTVPKNHTAPFHTSPDSEQRILLLVAGYLLAGSIIDSVKEGSTIIVHQPEKAIEHMLRQRTSGKDIKILFTTSGEIGPGDFQTISIPAKTSLYRLKSMLPAKTVAFFDLSDIRSNPGDLATRIRSCLPTFCKQKNYSSFLATESELVEGVQLDHANILLRLAIDCAVSGPFAEDVIPINMIDPRDISFYTNNRGLLSSVLDWTASPTVPVRVELADHKNLFSKDKTYIMVGLTADVGNSLCEWMIGKGARYLVLTSRNPQLSEEWLKMMKDMGAVITIESLDVTSRDAVHTFVEKIRSTHPPIAGVANGAMVLRDTMFSNMDLETMVSVLKPKVDGSRYLSECFPENTLDFFIMFGSLASVLGNSGQSNYNAANMFLTGLAAQRRKRGLAGSCMDLAGIIGLGYLSRANLFTHQLLIRAGTSFTSERDLHQVFAEAVIAGKPDSERNSELTVGLRRTNASEHPPVPWYNNPRFSHYVIEEEIAKSTGDKKNTVMVKKELESATNLDEAYQVIKTCFFIKVQITLQLPADVKISEQVPLSELGVDSLVAVDIRTWFQKELEVDMAVLKLLAGASIGELLRDALEKVPKIFMPNLKSEKIPSVEEKPKTDIIQVDATQGPSSSSDAESSPIELNFTSVPTSGLSETDGSSRNLSDEEEDLYAEFKELEPEVVAAPTLTRAEKMSIPQATFWFLKHYLQDQTTFNITFSTCMSGDLRIDDLERAVRTVGEKHEILQTCFFEGEDGELMQGIMENPPFHLEQKNIDDEDEVKVEFEKIRTHVYDIEHGETLRVVLLKLSPTTNFIIVGYPHIALDGHSFSVFFSEVQDVYNGKMLSPATLKYTDFATSTRKAIQNGDMQIELDFWKKEFATVPSPMPLLPFSQVTNRHPVSTYAQNLVDHRLDQALGLKIKAVARQNSCTPFHFFLTTMKTLLFRLLDTDDICIGIADANRSEKDAMGVMGLFLNLLPLRFRAVKKQSFAQAIKETRDKAYSALANDRLPFDTLVNELNIQRDVTYSPLFQAFFDYRQTTPEKQPFGNCTTEKDVWDFGRTSYDFNIDILENPTGASVITLKTQAGLYSRDDTEKLMGIYINLLQSFVGSARIRLDDPTMSTDLEVKKVALHGQGRSMVSTWPATLVHRIEQIIKQHPDRIAVKDGNNTILTYQAFFERVQAIALALLKSGVEPGQRIAMYQDPSVDFVCSMLAVLRIGAVYVPLDLRNPLPRLAGIVADCQTVAILAHEKTMYDSPRLSPTAKIINVTGLSTSEVTPILTTPQSPAMVLYTSGSTGEPKGIVLSHSGLINEVEGFTQEYKVKAETILQQSAVSVDICNAQVFTALSLGGSLYVVPKEKRGDPFQLCNLILEEKITYTKATSSEYSMLIKYGKEILSKCQHWTTAWSAGETLSPQQALDFRILNLPQLRLFNSYGPAEISMSCTKIEIPYWAEDILVISAGRPLPNYSIYVVDKAGKRLPEGLIGEICVGGPGVAKGYLHQEELTKAKFVPNIFATPEQKALGWDRLYRTGDRGYFAPDGTLLFKGRMNGDSQVKLRGLRIELGDIESTIIRTGNGAISEAIASLVGEPPFIIAHVVLSTTSKVKDKQAYLKTILNSLELPQYMVPALLVPLDQLPLTPHAKVDRRAIQALPLPTSNLRAQTQTELTNMEHQVVALWANVIPEHVLGNSNLDADTDFFKVGGNSLLLVRLQAIIRERFSIILPLVKLYEYSTISKLAGVIKDSSALQPILWEDEVKLRLSHGRGSELHDPQPLNVHNKNVLLTGATGYLGKHILDQLVSDNNVSEIHCVAIRRKEGQGLEESRIQNPSDKIVEYSGDLSSRRLGLSIEDFDNLAGSVDLIIHSGANRAFWEDYRVLRKPNLGSTMELVNLSARRKIPIHFVSSGGVLLLGDQPQIHPVSMNQSPPPDDGSNGYVASKWAAEVYLQNAARRLSIPICIHRTTPSPSSVAIPTGMLDDIVRISTKIEAFPILDDWRGTLDLMSVSTMAKHLLTVPFYLSGSEVGQPKFIHHASQVKISSVELDSALTPYVQLGMFEKISLLKWIGRLKEEGFGYFVASQDATMSNGGSGAFVSRR